MTIRPGRRTLTASAFVAALCASGPAALPAHGSLLGQPLQMDWRLPDSATVYFLSEQFVVSGAVEVPDVITILSADVTSSGVTFDWFHSPNVFTGHPFNGVAIIDYTGTVPAFTNVTIDPASNLAGFDSARITYDADTIYLNWQGLSYTPDTLVRIAIDTEAVASPEPSSAVVLGVGLATLLMRQRRRS